MVPFPASASPFSYSLSGTDATHFPDNQTHYVKYQALVTEISDACNKFKSENPDWTLRLNDSSLEFGGVFDVDAVWTPSASPGHIMHRDGTNMDVNWKAYETGVTGKVMMPPQLVRRIRELLEAESHIVEVQVHSAGTDNVHFHTIGKQFP
jgi:hypothetical protein